MNKYTEIIDKYLSGNMTAEEKRDFENNLNNDPHLKVEFEAQKQILRGINRSGIKTEIKKGLKKGSFKSKAGKFITGLLITALAVSLIWVAKNKMVSSNKENVRYELNEENNKNWSDADKHLSPELFTINGKNDTVVETKGGIIITIPANAFLSTGENIELEVKEALNPLDIMKAGLSTTSNGKLLETGGMFYINARENGKNLKIDQSKGLYVSIPDNNPGKNMMLFEGKRMANGQINWVDPKPFENKLNTVDILSLNFYPPHFLDSLHAFGFDIKNKQLTDSIYYSFVCGYPSDSLIHEDFNNDSFDNDVSIPRQRTSTAAPLPSMLEKIDGATLFKRNCSFCHSMNNQRLTGPGLAGLLSRVPIPAKTWLTKYILNNEKVMKSGDAYANKIYNEYGKVAMTVFEGQLNESEITAIIDYITNGSPEPVDDSGKSNCEIEPYRIHAIWNRKFNNTILATKEFEERLQAIFGTCNHSILDLYIHNMDKKMYEIDSIASEMLNESRLETMPVFKEFYNRKDGGVSINKSHMKKLQEYMLEKRKIYQDAAISTIRKIYEKEKILNEKAYDERIKHNTSEQSRINTVFKEELEVNMKEAYRQLGKEFKPTPPAGNYFSTTIVTTGWKNVDAYVIESTLNRTTLDYTDKETGKKAVIKYNSFTIKVSNFDKYDRVVAYLIPNKLSSFQRMPINGKGFKENLNELFSYSTMVFGFKGEEVYAQHVVDAKPGEVTLELNEMSEEDLKKYRYMNTGAKIEMAGEINYQIFEQKESLGKKAIEKRNEVTKRLRKVVFPCYTEPQQQQAIPSEIELYN